MRAYIIRRLLILIPTLLLLTFLIFIIVSLVPGDIIDAMQARASEIELDRAAIEHALGLDAPIFVQYGRWMGVVPQMDGNFHGLFQGSLGASWWRKMPVVELVALSWPVTIELGLLGLIIANLISLPIGIYSALRQDKWGDYIARSYAILCISVPAFWVGTMVILFPAIWWGYMPPVMLTHFTEDPIGNLRMFIIPAIVLGMSMQGANMRITRTMMLEVLRQDYIRTAWAKGLRERVVILRHALKNALIPVITIIGERLPIMVGGTVIIEQIFQLPGMGRLIINSTMRRDYPVVSGTLLIFGVAMVLSNLIVDLTYAYLDPRVHYK
ncbi:MAG: ABC transporter permease [Desulfobacterales bacterium]|nr:ABC transporter permease [Desulfobacterales bacterium]